MIGCETLVGAALFACVARNPACLPVQHRPLHDVLSAMAEQESGFRPNAIRDETTGQSLFPATRAEAERLAGERLARKHTLGGGWFQITHARNWARHGLDVRTVFDPCLNMRAGAQHFSEDLVAALTRYNRGTLTGPQDYATAVLARLPRLRAIYQTQPAQQASRAAGGPLPCPGAPPSWDAWGTARHAEACARRAAKTED